MNCVQWARADRSEGNTIGIVPTMGALHAGHASLIRAASHQCGFVAVSIFVNPTQFGPNEDFSRYPRTFEADCALAKAEGADVIFAPSVEELYPAGAATFVEVEGLSNRLDGASRPGHFRGVATVVSQAADRHRSRPGLLRPERRSPGRGAAPHGDRSAPAGGDCRLPDRARAGRPRAQLAQRLSERCGARAGAGVEPLGAACGVAGRDGRTARQDSHRRSTGESSPPSLPCAWTISSWSTGIRCCRWRQLRLARCSPSPHGSARHG